MTPKCRYSPDPNLGAMSPFNLSQTGIGQINGGAPTGDDPISLNTAFPKGKALADWLAGVFPPAVSGNNSSYGQVTCDYVFDNASSSLNTEPTTYASSTSSENPPDGRRPARFRYREHAGRPPRGEPVRQGVHIDAHVNAASSGDADYVGWQRRRSARRRAPTR